MTIVMEAKARRCDKRHKKRVSTLPVKVGKALLRK
jgi:hypothetical protein